MIEFNNKELEKEVEDTAKQIVDLVNSNLKKGECLLGGSVAKGTYLYEDIDFDLFVRFKKEEDMSHLLDTLEKTFPDKDIQVVHGTRDYYHIQYESYMLEFVPTLYFENPENCENSVDVSIFHVKWFLENKKKIPNLSNEVRKAKLFFKANYLYGAESYIKGFSGHVIDILVVYYKSFENLIENACEWSEKEIIDLNDFYKNKKEIFNTLSDAKVYSPLIVIDPILETRNAAAALSTSNFNKFIEISKKYMKNPSDKFFIIKNINFDEIDKKNTLILEFEWLNEMRDVAGSKVKKVIDVIKHKLKKKKYFIRDFFWDYNNTCWIKLKKYDHHYILRGPPLRLKENVLEFKKKHKSDKFFEKDNRIYCKIKRELSPVDVILKRKEFIKNRVKSLKIYYYKNNKLINKEKIETM